MKITLRRAAALQSQIADKIKTFKTSADVELNVHEPFLKQISKAKEKFQKEENSRLLLISTMYEIRKLVGESNVSSGVSEILTELSAKEELIKFYSKASSSKPRPTDDFIHGSLSSLKSKSESGATNRYSPYGENDSLAIGILTQEEINNMLDLLSDLEREKIILKDKLVSLNASTEITISDKSSDTLKEHKLI